MAVSTQVQIVKALLYLGECWAINRSPGDRHQQLVRLPRVARVYEALETAARRRNAGAVEHGGSLFLERRECGLDLCRIERGSRSLERVHVIALEVGTDESEC